LNSNSVTEKIAEKITESALLAHAKGIPDPEIPVLTLGDLGIVRSVQLSDTRVLVALTPTYSGCPATDVISAQVRAELGTLTDKMIDVQIQLSPAWTTDWLTEAGAKKLKEYGIAPPGRRCSSGDSVEAVRWGAKVADGIELIACPRCESEKVERLSQHGSTPCKALYRCISCREPFDYFKPH
jgi:ring-1,2-phenylacetyl-CoA epoxidase subunit PaaD